MFACLTQADWGASTELSKSYVCLCAKTLSKTCFGGIRAKEEKGKRSHVHKNKENDRLPILKPEKKHAGEFRI